MKGDIIMKENSDKENSDEKVEKKDSTASSTKFSEKLDFAQTNKSSKDVDKENKPSKDQVPEDDPNAFPMIGGFLNSDRWKDIKSGKSKLVMGISIFVGALLIGSGVFLMMGSPERVADNAEFGDEAFFSVFLMLMGALLISGAVARKFIDKSFFKGINDEIESIDGTSSNSTKENIKRDNINRDNR
jgi:hypothetical protein